MQEQNQAENIEHIIAHIVEFAETIGDRKFDEAATKQFIVLPILRSLGWDDRNLETLEVFPETRTSPESDTRTRVDYALRHEGRELVFIECKRWGEDLEKHREQLARYIFQKGVDLGVLTNGNTWDFYYAYKTDVPWDDRKFCTIKLNNQKDAVTHFQRFLSKRNVTNGKAKAAAEERVQPSSERADLSKPTYPPSLTEGLKPQPKTK